MLRRIVFVLILVGGAFGAGFGLGRGMLGDLKGKMAEMEQQAGALRTNLSQVRARGHLVDAMASLREVSLDIVDQNFGEARASLARAKQSVSKAASDRELRDEMRQKIEGVRIQIEEIEADLKALRAGAREKIDRLVDELRTLTR